MGKIVQALVLVISQAIVDLEHRNKVTSDEFLRDLELHVANLGYVLPKDFGWIVAGVEVLHRALLEETDKIRTELYHMSPEEAAQSILRRRIRRGLFDALEDADELQP